MEPSENLKGDNVGTTVGDAARSSGFAANSAPHRADDSYRFISEFAKNQHTVHAYIRALVFNRSDAEDIMQEVSITLWNKWHTFELGTDFLKWACSVAFIEILRYRRKSAKDRLWFNEPLLELLAADFREHADLHATQLDALSQCIEKLNCEDRRLVEIRYREGGSVRGLADEYGKPLSTVYKMLLRIRQTLRRCVDSTVAAQSHASPPQNT
jgi:RNA polymerase sigma-70 factor (ECF subfamily)